MIFDVITRSKVLTLPGHIDPVTSIRFTSINSVAEYFSWSKNGRYFVSSSSDWNVIVWDLVELDRAFTLRLNTPIDSVHLDPSNSNLIVCTQDSWPMVVEWAPGEEYARSHSFLVPSSDALSSDTHKDSPNKTCVVSFDLKGKRLLVGTNKGYIHAFSFVNHDHLFSTKITSNSPIRQIVVSRNGKNMLVNAADRILRLYSLSQEQTKEPELLNKFQDLVNRIQWSSCCFNWTGDYVMGASSDDHKLYVWDLNIGSLTKILEGPKEPVEDMSCHPLKPLMASVSNIGVIYLWTKTAEENWSAFAPDFKELETNVEYIEKEDEFDIIPEEEVTRRKFEEEDIDVDVVTIEKIQPFGDDDDEWELSDDVLNVPIYPDDIASGAEDEVDIFTLEDRENTTEQQKKKRRPATEDGSAKSKKKRKKAKKSKFSLVGFKFDDDFNIVA